MIFVKRLAKAEKGHTYIVAYRRAYQLTFTQKWQHSWTEGTMNYRKSWLLNQNLCMWAFTCRQKEGERGWREGRREGLEAGADTGGGAAGLLPPPEQNAVVLFLISKYENALRFRRRQHFLCQLRFSGISTHGA